MYYLLGWDEVEVNAQDNQGNTPLHIAIKFAENFGDLRSIKELLMKGADRNKRDKDGNKPVDHVSKFVKNDKLENDLRLLLVIMKKYLSVIFLGEPKSILHRCYGFMLCEIAFKKTD